MRALWAGVFLLGSYLALNGYSYEPTNNERIQSTSNADAAMMPDSGTSGAGME